MCYQFKNNVQNCSCDVQLYDPELKDYVYNKISSTIIFGNKEIAEKAIITTLDISK